MGRNLFVFSPPLFSSLVLNHPEEEGKGDGEGGGVTGGSARGREKGTGRRGWGDAQLLPHSCEKSLVPTIFMKAAGRGWDSLPTLQCFGRAVPCPALPASPCLEAHDVTCRPFCECATPRAALLQGEPSRISAVRAVEYHHHSRLVSVTPPTSFEVA